MIAEKSVCNKASKTIIWLNKKIDFGVIKTYKLQSDAQ